MLASTEGIRGHGTVRSTSSISVHRMYKKDTKPYWTAIATAEFSIQTQPQAAPDSRNTVIEAAGSGCVIRNPLRVSVTPRVLSSSSSAGW